MKESPEHNKRVAEMKFSSVYPHYVSRIIKNGRTEAELREIIEWLTGFDEKKLQTLIDENVTIENFYTQAKINPNAHLIKGMICGYRIEELENTITRRARYLDKMIDELAKGRKMEKILRNA